MEKDNEKSEEQIKLLREEVNKNSKEMEELSHKISITMDKIEILSSFVSAWQHSIK